MLAASAVTSRRVQRFTSLPFLDLPTGTKQGRDSDHIRNTAVLHTKIFKGRELCECASNGTNAKSKMVRRDRAKLDDERVQVLRHVVHSDLQLGTTVAGQCLHETVLEINGKNHGNQVKHVNFERGRIEWLLIAALDGIDQVRLGVVKTRLRRDYERIVVVAHINVVVVVVDLDAIIVHVVGGLVYGFGSVVLYCLVVHDGR